MRTLAHVTHEAIHKSGGIGTVLEGLLTSRPYLESDARTILIGPLFPGDEVSRSTLGPTGEILYSSFSGTRRHPASDALDRAHRDWHVGIVYGHRVFTNPHNGEKSRPEVALIDVEHMNLGRLNPLKHRLWERYGLDSSRYEHSWEFDLYVKLAGPTLSVLRALGAAGKDDPCIILAHEWMGMPTALTAMMDSRGSFGTVFYAHEVAPMRRIVEAHPGHDVTFYNILDKAVAGDRFVDDVFGDQHDYYRHALVGLAHECDAIFSVGDQVSRELHFMGPDFGDARIVTTYNGIPFEKISLEQKFESKQRLQAYAAGLLGDRPDHVFSHVTRTTVSKGLWRDLLVLSELEQHFRQTGETAVLFVLSTEVPPRLCEDIVAMEESWDWPVAHREIAPDLSHGEAMFYQGVQAFNARARQIKIVFINQFGFSREVCGHRMSEDMMFMDIRRGVDAEFGQSIYEPFGISHLEALTFGGVCVLSRICGCAGFIDKVVGGEQIDNVIVADYADLGTDDLSETSLLALDRRTRFEQEKLVAPVVARELFERLPRDAERAEALLTRGYEVAQQMSWDVVAGDHVLPELEAIARQLRHLRVA